MPRKENKKLRWYTQPLHWKYMCVNFPLIFLGSHLVFQSNRLNLRGLDQCESRFWPILCANNTVYICLTALMSLSPNLQETVCEYWQFSNYGVLHGSSLVGRSSEFPDHGNFKHLECVFLRINAMELNLNKECESGGGCGRSRGGADGFIDRSKVRILLCDNDSKCSREVFTLLLSCSYQGTYELIYIQSFLESSCCLSFHLFSISQSSF